MLQEPSRSPADANASPRFPDAALRWVTERCLRITISDRYAPADRAARARSAAAALRLALPDHVVDAVPTAQGLLVTWRDAASAALAEQRVAAALAAAPAAQAPAALVEIPFCAAAEFAPDLPAVAAAAGCSAADFLARFAAIEYTAEFLGFTPGFAYLRGLPDSLAVPRLDQPRLRVAAGSVALAGTQVGVYPQAGPGGWRIVGRTPLRMFDAARPAPSLLSAGDRVRFLLLDRARFDALAAGTRADG